MCVKRRCKLYECKRCFKTFSDGQVSRTEDVCRSCIRVEDDKHTRTKKKKEGRVTKGEDLGKMAKMFENDN